jgi:hypothetical protein
MICTVCLTARGRAKQLTARQPVHAAYRGQQLIRGWVQRQHLSSYTAGPDEEVPAFQLTVYTSEASYTTKTGSCHQSGVSDMVGNSAIKLHQARQTRGPRAPVSRHPEEEVFQSCCGNQLACSVHVIIKISARRLCLLHEVRQSSQPHVRNAPVHARKCSSVQCNAVQGIGNLLGALCTFLNTKSSR